MKTKAFSFLTAIVLALAMNAQAQYTITESWYLTGNTGSSSSFLGTTNYSPLVFKTNNTTRMTLSASYPYLGIKEVEQKQDVDLGEMNTLLLQKMEEMTLYIIQLEKRVSELENK